MEKSFVLLRKWLEEVDKRRIYFLIFFIAALGMLLSLHFSGYFYHLFLLNSYGGEALDHNTIYFSLDSDTDSIDLSRLQDGQIICNATLLAHAPATGEEYCVLYTNGKDDIFGGEYFSDWNFISGRAGCIMGASAEKNPIDGMVCLESGRYEVLAIRKESFIAGINSAVFFTNSLLDRVSSNEILAVASLKKSEVSASYTRLEKYMESTGVKLHCIKFRTITPEDFLDYNSVFFLALGGFALLLFVIYFLLYWYWNQYKKPWCRVMYLFGIQNPKFRVAGKFIIILLIADFFGGILYCAAGKEMYFWWRSILIGSVIVFGIQVIAVLSGVFLSGLFEGGAKK